jgi:hypothetical protein
MQFSMTQIDKTISHTSTGHERTISHKFRFYPDLHLYLVSGGDERHQVLQAEMESHKTNDEAFSEVSLEPLLHQNLCTLKQKHIENSSSSNTAKEELDVVVVPRFAQSVLSFCCWSLL